jgi:predicted heme/steroid binding protein/YHS domain-containing protein
MKILIALLTAGMVASCAAQEQKKDGDAWKTRVFTAEELKKYDGQNGQPVYVAADGIVYDLTKSKYWKTGTHMKQHAAGEDLSQDLHERAPKGIHKDGKILEKMPKVGVLAGYAGPAVAEKPAPAEQAPLLALHKPAGEELGREASCPVTGKKITVAEATPALALKGKTYYFSDELSLEKFKKNPGKYLGGLKDKGKDLLKKKKG